MAARGSHSLSGALSFAAALLLAWPAHAQAPREESAPRPRPERPDAKEAAGKEAAAGDKAFAAGDHAAALAHYEAAYGLYPTPNLQFNRGLALVELKRPVDATIAFEAFLDGAKDAPANARKYAEEQIAKLERKVARVRVRAKPSGKQTEISGAKVALNGKVVAELPLARALVVEPGDYRVEVTAGGYRPYIIDNISLIAGSPQVIVAQLAPVDLAIRNDPGGRANGQGESRSVFKTWWFWGLTGVVAIGATVATILILGAGDGIPDSDLGTVEPQF